MMIIHIKLKYGITVIFLNKCNPIYTKQDFEIFNSIGFIFLNKKSSKIN